VLHDHQLYMNLVHILSTHYWCIYCNFCGQWSFVHSWLVFQHRD